MDRYLVNWLKSSLILSIPYSEEQVFCLMVLSVLISGANLGSFLKIPICSSSYNQSLICAFASFLTYPEEGSWVSLQVIFINLALIKKLFFQYFQFRTMMFRLKWRNLRRTDLLFHKGPWSAPSLLRGHQLLTIRKILSFKFILGEYSHPLSILSKPNFNQQLNWTEFEVRLHSYPMIHHPPQTLCCCC